MKSLDNELLSTCEMCSQVKDCYDLSLTFKTIMTFISGNKCRKIRRKYLLCLLRKEEELFRKPIFGFIRFIFEGCLVRI
jgi:hypothetical protein